MIQARHADAADPVLEAFIEWSQGLRWVALPEATRHTVKRELLDYLGSAIAGRTVAGIPRWLSVLADMGGRPDCLGHQFSVHWAVANALVYGEVTPRQLVEEVPPSQRVKDQIARITCNADAAAGERDVGGCTLRVHGPFGVREVQETHAKGHPANPFTDEELLAKFHANTRLGGVNAAEATELAGTILGLDRKTDPSRLAAHLEAVAATGHQ